MRVGVFAIVPDLVSPEKSSPARFSMVRTFGAFHVTEQTSPTYQFAPFEQEVTLPVGSHNPTGSVPSASARLHNNSVNVVLEGAAPCGGTSSKIVARRAGVPRSIRARRTLSTGLPVQARQVDDESRVLPAQGGVRCGVYTSPIKKMTSLLAVPAALVTAVGR
jgi:hypothetical protein